MPEPRCPFYGRYLAIDAGLDAPIFLVAMPDQCALITGPSSPAPCVMKQVHQTPVWANCVRNPINNGSYVGPDHPRVVEGDALTIEVPAGPLAIVAPIPIHETPAERVGRLIRANPAPLVPKDVSKDEDDR